MKLDVKLTVASRTPEAFWLKNELHSVHVLHQLKIPEKTRVFKHLLHFLF